MVTLSRREFNQRVVLAAAGAILSQGPETQPEPKFPVALVSDVDRKRAIRTAVESLGEYDFKGKAIYLKADFNSREPFPASTHPETLSSVAEWLKEKDCDEIYLVERSGMGITREILRALGIDDIQKRLDLTYLCLDELADLDWRREILAGSHWKQGVEVPRFINRDSCIVQVCNLKTHRFGGYFSASLKNSIGLIAKHAHTGSRHNYMAELHGSPDQRLMIAEVNQVYAPALVVMDAMDVFVGGGPEKGDLAHPKIIAASRDRVAIDAVGVALLRIHNAGYPLNRNTVFEQEQLKRAVELKIGTQSAKQIDFLTIGTRTEILASRLRPLISEEPEVQKKS